MKYESIILYKSSNKRAHAKQKGQTKAWLPT